MNKYIIARENKKSSVSMVLFHMFKVKNNFENREAIRIFVEYMKEKQIKTV